MERYIEIFIKYILNNPNADDGIVLDYLIESEIPDKIAHDIIVFTPTAFNRYVFKDSGIKFSDSYITRIEKGEKSLSFNDNEIFILSQEYFLKYLNEKISKVDLIKIIGRCSEFDIITQAIENGSNLSDLSIQPMLLIY